MLCCNAPACKAVIVAIGPAVNDYRRRGTGHVGGATLKGVPDPSTECDKHTLVDESKTATGDFCERSNFQLCPIQGGQSVVWHLGGVGSANSKGCRHWSISGGVGYPPGGGTLVKGSFDEVPKGVDLVLAFPDDLLFCSQLIKPPVDALKLVSSSEEQFVQEFA